MKYSLGILLVQNMKSALIHILYEGWYSLAEKTHQECRKRSSILGEKGRLIFRIYKQFHIIAYMSCSWAHFRFLSVRKYQLLSSFCTLFTTINSRYKGKAECQNLLGNILTLNSSSRKILQKDLPFSPHSTPLCFSLHLKMMSFPLSSSEKEFVKT